MVEGLLAAYSRLGVYCDELVQEVDLEGRPTGGKPRLQTFPVLEVQALQPQFLVCQELVALFLGGDLLVNGDELFFFGVGLEHDFLCDDLEENAAERPQVDGVVVLFGPKQQFRSPKEYGPHFVCEQKLLIPLELFGHAEVDKPQRNIPAPARHHHIRGLQISVQKAMLVHRLHRHRQFPHHFLLIQRRRRAYHIGEGQIFPFHDKIDGARQGVDVDGPEHIGALDGVEGMDFSDGAGGEALVGHILELLDGIEVAGVQILGLEHNAVCAFCDLLQNEVLGCECGSLALAVFSTVHASIFNNHYRLSDFHSIQNHLSAFVHWWNCMLTSNFASPKL